MGKENKYILLTDIDESSFGINRWVLSLTKDDLNKIRYIKEISEESWEKFDGDGNDLILGLDVTYAFIPESKPSDRIRPIGSMLSYVGDDEFIVKCDFINDWDDPSYIITDRFKIDL